MFEKASNIHVMKTFCCGGLFEQGGYLVVMKKCMQQFLQARCLYLFDKGHEICEHLIDASFCNRQVFCQSDIGIFNLPETCDGNLNGVFKTDCTPLCQNYISFFKNL